MAFSCCKHDAKPTTTATLGDEASQSDTKPKADQAIEKEPARHADYLAREWKLEDIWSSWRYVVAGRIKNPSASPLLFVADCPEPVQALARPNAHHNIPPGVTVSSSSLCNTMKTSSPTPTSLIPNDGLRQRLRKRYFVAFSKGARGYVVSHWRRLCDGFGRLGLWIKNGSRAIFATGLLKGQRVVA